MLFAPCCAKCSEFISGRVLRALGPSWPPACLTCHHCEQPVADQGFTKVGQVVIKVVTKVVTEVAKVGKVVTRTDHVLKLTTYYLPFWPSTLVRPKTRRL